MQYSSVVRVPIYNNKKSFGMPLYRAFPKDLLMKYNYVPTFFIRCKAFLMPSVEPKLECSAR